MVPYFVIPILVVITIIFSIKRAHNYWKRNGFLQMEKPHPLFGHFTELFKQQINPQSFSRKLYEKAKKEGYKFVGIYQLYAPILVVSDIELIKRILIKDFEHFEWRGEYHNEREPLTINMVNVAGQKWKSLRQRFTSNFTSGKIKMVFQTMADCADVLTEMFQKYADEKQTIEIKNEFMKFTMDIIGNVVFGIECNCMKDPNTTEFQKYGTSAFQQSRTRRIFMQTSPKWLINLFGIRRIHKDVGDFFQNLVQSNMEYREKNKIRRNDFLQVMVDLQKRMAQNPDEPELTLTEITTECFMFFAGGFETSSTVSTFALYELARHQDIQEKLRNHINEVLERHDNKYTYEAFMDMTYLDQCINETMRMYILAPLLPRVCTKEYNIPGTNLIIHKGNKVFIPVVGMHFDPEYYPEPEKYNPERFSKELIASRPSVMFLPFGEGPRQCIGMRFGLLQTKIGIANIIRNFKVTLNEKTIQPLELIPNAFIITARGGIWLDLERV